MSSTLFPIDEAKSDAGTATRVDFFNLYAVQKAGMPEGWRWYSSEVLNYQAPRSQQSFLLSGAVVPNKTKGKRAGEPNWRARDKRFDRKIAVSVRELEAFQREWELAQGRCSDCFGSGQSFAGWSQTEGTRYRPCKRCSASGRPPVDAVSTS